MRRASIILAFTVLVSAAAIAVHLHLRSTTDERYPQRSVERLRLILGEDRAERCEDPEAVEFFLEWLARHTQEAWVERPTRFEPFPELRLHLSVSASGAVELLKVAGAPSPEIAASVRQAVEPVLPNKPLFGNINCLVGYTIEVPIALPFYVAPEASSLPSSRRPQRQRRHDSVFG